MKGTWQYFVDLYRLPRVEWRSYDYHIAWFMQSGRYTRLIVLNREFDETLYVGSTFSCGAQGMSRPSDFENGGVPTAARGWPCGMRRTRTLMRLQSVSSHCRSALMQLSRKLRPQ